MTMFEQSELERIENLPESQQKNILYRQFRMSPESISLMDKTIIDNINTDVQENDTLYLLGDFAFVKTHEQAKVYRDRINCRNIILIWGNHDNRQLLAGLFQGYFDLLDINVQGQKITLCHYPLVQWNGSGYGSIMLHGHCHGNLEEWKKQYMGDALLIDIGVDCNNFHPFSLKNIEEKIKLAKGYSSKL